MYYSDYDFYRCAVGIIIILVMLCWGISHLMNFIIIIKTKFKKKVNLN